MKPSKVVTTSEEPKLKDTRDRKLVGEIGSADCTEKMGLWAGRCVVVTCAH